MEEKVNRIGGLYDTENQKHQAGSIYDRNGLAPTLDTASGGHRQPLIWERYNNKALNETLATNQEHEPNLKQQLCDKLIQNGMVQEYDVIRHSYSTNRLENGEKNMGRVENREHLSPALDTRRDCLGVCVKDTSYVGQSGLIQPIDRNYKEHGVDREEHIEWKNDNTSHALRTTVIPVTTNKSYRIRKLTPKECGRLMGVKDEDIDKMSVNQSNSKLYHLYGDSIVVGVLCEIFKQML